MDQGFLVQGVCADVVDCGADMFFELVLKCVDECCGLWGGGVW